MASPARNTDSVERAIAAEERRGVMLAMRVRVAGLAVIAAWVLIENPFPLAWYYLGLAGFLAVSGLVPLLGDPSTGGLRWQYAQAAIDAAVVSGAALVPNPADPSVLPAPLQLRLSNELFLFGLVALSALSYSPKLVLWSGLVGALAWSAGVGWVVSLPETVVSLDIQEWGGMTVAERTAWLLEPGRVLVGVWGRQIILLLLVAATLSVAVARARRLVVRQASLERDRANLSRYFSPKLVDELARSGAPVGATRRHAVVVLFADLAGFTTVAASRAPERVIELLREYHRRVSHEVFAHDGTLEEYLGDGVMATFGNPEPSGRDATHALLCARRILASVAAWSDERVARGETPMRVRLGVHRGPVVIGNVGEEQLQFAVVGDAVNVANRLQELGKELGASLVVSQEVIDAAQAEGLSVVEATSGLRDGGLHVLRGRLEATRVWAVDAG